MWLTAGKPEFKSFNHSQDDTFMITRAGGRNLFIIDLEQFTIDEMVPDFWMHNDSLRNPICAASSRDADIILGVSVSDEGPCFHYFNKNIVGTSRVKSEYVRKSIPEANSISAIESSEKGKSVIVGGSTDTCIFFAAIGLDTGVKLVSKAEAKDGQYGRPFKIRRIVGTEYYIAGCAKHMIVIKAFAGRVSLLRSYKDVHTDYINDIVIVRNAIFSKARQEPYVKISYFGDSIKSIVESKNPMPATVTTPAIPTATRINVQLLGMEKLFVSLDTTKLIVANRAGVHYFQRATRDSDFEKTKTGVLSSYGVHSAMITPSGHLMAQETGTNDLVLLQGEGNEFARHKGKPSFDMGQLKQLIESVKRNAFNHNNNGHKVVWFSGQTDVSVVNLKEFSFVRINNILPFVEKNAETVMLKATYNADCSKICILFTANGSPCVTVITPTTREPDHFLLQELIPNSSFLCDSSFFCRVYREQSGCGICLHVV